jgi:hypothetical protein
MSAPAAYRLGDGAPVTSDAARAIWASVARELLEESARRNPAGITRSELAKLVQQRSGVHTRVPVDEWLTGVVDEAAAGDVHMASLCRPDAPAVKRASPTRAPRTRSASTVARKREAPVAICPTCFMQLPSSGRCDTCG